MLHSARRANLALFSLLTLLPFSAWSAPDGERMFRCEVGSTYDHCEMNADLSVDLNGDGYPELLSAGSDSKVRIYSLVPSYTSNAWTGEAAFWLSLTDSEFGDHLNDANNRMQIRSVGDMDGVAPAQHDFVVVDAYEFDVPSGDGEYDTRYRTRVTLFAGNNRSVIDSILIANTTSSYSGTHRHFQGVTGIGDVNGDGRVEFAILTNDTEQGDRLSVITLNAENELEVLYSFDPGPNTASYGTVFAVNDVSGDGIPDYAISRVEKNGNRGELIFYKGQSGTPFIPYNQPGTLQGTATNQKFGRHAQIIKDVDNDGIDDIVVSGNYDGPNGNRIFTMSMKTGAIISELHVDEENLGTIFSASSAPKVNSSTPGVRQIVGDLDVNADNVVDIVSWSDGGSDKFIFSDVLGNHLHTEDSVRNYGREVTRPVLGGIGSYYSAFNAYDAVILGRDAYNGSPYGCPDPNTHFITDAAGVPGDGGPIQIEFLSGCLKKGGFIGFRALNLNPATSSEPNARVLSAISAEGLNQPDYFRGIPLLLARHALDWANAANVTYCFNNDCSLGNGAKWYAIDNISPSGNVQDGYLWWYLQVFQTNHGATGHEAASSDRIFMRIKAR